MSITTCSAVFLGLTALLAQPAIAQDITTKIVSPYASWSADASGVLHDVTVNEMPDKLTKPVINIPQIVPRPAGAELSVPPGFKVELLKAGLVTPRTMRFAPDGDLFVAESKAGRITVLRMADHGRRVASSSTFATGLDWPFGIAFWPPGPDPRYVYIGAWNEVVRYPYRNGDLRAGGAAEPVIARLPTEGHWTRDLAFSPNGRHLFVAVGSLSNDAEKMPRMSAAGIQAFQKTHGIGAAWGAETGRATVLETTPTGHPVIQFANGIRNCVGMVIAPNGKALWCAVNERDQRGDNLPDDYVTLIVKGGFYGWPWFYIGNHQDPTHLGQRPDLMGRVITPEVLFPAHSAPLTLTFYEAHQFPASFFGDIFVALHGSYNRSRLTGYKVVRVFMKNGLPTGEYEDFLTGFVIDNRQVWGRPVGVTVAPDGSLLVSDDGSGSIWRISYVGR